MIDRDLPEPQAAELSPEALKERQWRLWSTINVFLFGYAILHKLIVPFMRMSVTPLSVDWWWLFHGFLAIALYRKNLLWTRTISSIGMGFDTARLLIVSSVTGATWMLLSLWMTEGLSAFFLLFLLRGIGFRLKNVHAAAIGAGMGLILFFVQAPSAPKVAPQPLNSSKAVVSETQGKLAHQENSCGALHLRVSGETFEKQMNQNALRVLPCGFEFSMMNVSGELMITNESGKFLNLRFESLSKDHSSTWRFLKNVPLFHMKSTQFHMKDVADLKLVKITSDSWPKAGMVFIRPEGSSLGRDEWVEASLEGGR